jgi:hypothetical protein
MATDASAEFQLSYAATSIKIGLLSSSKDIKQNKWSQLSHRKCTKKMLNKERFISWIIDFQELVPLKRLNHVIFFVSSSCYFSQNDRISLENCFYSSGQNFSRFLQMAMRGSGIITALSNGNGVQYSYLGDLKSLVLITRPIFCSGKPQGIHRQYYCLSRKLTCRRISGCAILGNMAASATVGIWPWTRRSEPCKRAYWANPGIAGNRFVATRREA